MQQELEYHSELKNKQKGKNNGNFALFRNSLKCKNMFGNSSCEDY